MDRMTGLRAREAKAWQVAVARKKRYTDRSISRDIRVDRIISEIFPSLLWGCALWSWCPDVLRATVASMTRFARWAGGFRQRPGEDPFTYRLRSLRQARDILTRLLRVSPAVFALRRAAVDISKLARASPWGLCGRLLRWRSPWDAAAWRRIAWEGGENPATHPEWTRGRVGRPRTRVEDVWRRVCGRLDWWNVAASWSRTTTLAAAHRAADILLGNFLG